MLKKAAGPDDYVSHLFVHLNDLEQFALFSGLRLPQFFRCFPSMRAVLFLKPLYEDASYNMHTRMSYVDRGEYGKFLRNYAEARSEICWVDFEDERRLNALQPQEQAELLYIGHKKECLRPPFYYQLQNRFVYLASADEMLTKIYFRTLRDAEALIASAFNEQLVQSPRLAAFWRRGAAAVVPSVKPEQIASTREWLEEGALLSLYRVSGSIGIDVRQMPESVFPDEIWDELNTWLRQPPVASLDLIESSK